MSRRLDDFLPVPFRRSEWPCFNVYPDLRARTTGLSSDAIAVLFLCAMCAWDLGNGWSFEAPVDQWLAYVPLPFDRSRRALDELAARELVVVEATTATTRIGVDFLHRQLVPKRRGQRRDVGPPQPPHGHTNDRGQGGNGRGSDCVGDTVPDRGRDRCGDTERSDTVDTASTGPVTAAVTPPDIRPPLSLSLSSSSPLSGEGTPRRDRRESTAGDESSNAVSGSKGAARRSRPGQSTRPLNPHWEAASDVLAYYAKHLQPDYRPDKAGHAVVIARLRDGHVVADLCTAVDGVLRSEFHMGDPTRRTVGIVFGSSDQVAKFVALKKASDKPTSPLPSTTATSPAARNPFNTPGLRIPAAHEEREPPTPDRGGEVGTGRT